LTQRFLNRILRHLADLAASAHGGEARLSSLSPDGEPGAGMAKRHHGE
jgi:hypothetical protein